VCGKETKPDNALVLSKRKQIGVKMFHVILGHASEEITIKTANRLGMKLTGQLTTCEDCSLAKIR
jgi:hypothetical protein